MAAFPRYGLQNELLERNVTVPASSSSTPTNVDSATGVPTGASNRGWGNVTSDSTYVSFLASTTGAKSVMFQVGTGTTIDGLGFSRHNVASMVIKEYWQVNSVYTSKSTTISSVPDTDTVFFRFTSNDVRYVRVTFTPTTGEQLLLGEVWFGTVLDLPRGFEDGFTPPELAGIYQTSSSTSRNGLLIGHRSYTLPTQLSFQLSGVGTGFITGAWETIKDHVRDGHMLWVEWNPDGYSRHGFAGYVQNNVAPTSYKPIGNSVSMTMVGQ